jgi:hypothetical protein
MSKKFAVGKTAYTIYGGIVVIKSWTATKVLVVDLLTDKEKTYDYYEISTSRAEAWAARRLAI